MDFHDIIFEKSGGVATLTLNRPSRMNAITPGMNRELSLAFEAVRTDDDIRVLIITGAGDGFCSGQDLGEMAKARVESSDGPKKVGARQMLRGAGWFAIELTQIEKPVIAAVNGAAVGGGLSIALACDIRIASDKARFCAPFVKRGLAPEAASSYYAPRVLGLPGALELYLTGDMIDAARAERMGLVNRVEPHDELMKVTMDLASRIARNAPISVVLTKRVLYRGAEASGPQPAFEFEAAALNWCFGTDDFKEGVRAFLEKRDPVFKGR